GASLVDAAKSKIGLRRELDVDVLGIFAFFLRSHRDSDVLAISGDGSDSAGDVWFLHAFFLAERDAGGGIGGTGFEPDGGGITLGRLGTVRADAKVSNSRLIADLDLDLFRFFALYFGRQLQSESFAIGGNGDDRSIDIGGILGIFDAVLFGRFLSS